jgi:hypothetical protein
MECRRSAPGRFQALTEPYFLRSLFSKTYNPVVDKLFKNEVEKTGSQGDIPDIGSEIDFNDK